MSVKIKVRGVETTQRFLKSKEKKLDRTLIPRGLTKAAIFLQGEVKQSIAGRRAEVTSVDTGAFLRSVDSMLISNNNAIVFSKIPYAKFLEFGTYCFYSTIG